MNEARKEIWLMPDTAEACDLRWSSKQQHYVRADLAFPKDVAVEMVVAMRALLNDYNGDWGAKPGAELTFAAIAKAEAILKGENR